MKELRLPTEPTLDDYVAAMRDLAKTLRRALDDPGSVPRGELRVALEQYERMDAAACL